MESIRDFLISRISDVKNQEINNHCIKYDYLSKLYHAQYCNKECAYNYHNNINLSMILSHNMQQLDTESNIDFIFSKEFTSSLTSFGGFHLQYTIHKTDLSFSKDYIETLVCYYKRDSEDVKNMFEL